MEIGDIKKVKSEKVSVMEPPKIIHFLKTDANL